VTLSPCTVRRHSEEQRQSPIRSALDEKEWSAPRPSVLNAGLRTPSNHLIGGWVSPETVWTLWRQQIFLTPAKNLARIFGRTVHSHYSDRAIPTATLKKKKTCRLTFHIFFVGLWKMWIQRADFCTSVGDLLISAAEWKYVLTFLSIINSLRSNFVFKGPSSITNITTFPCGAATQRGPWPPHS